MREIIVQMHRVREDQRRRDRSRGHLESTDELNAIVQNELLSSDEIKS